MYKMSLPGILIYVTMFVLYTKQLSPNPNVFSLTSQHPGVFRFVKDWFANKEWFEKVGTFMLDACSTN